MSVREFVARVIVALDVLATGGSEPPREPGAWDKHAVPALIPQVNPLTSDQGSSSRREAALRMMDEDCFGFLLLTIHKDDLEPIAEIRLTEHLFESWWPAVCLTLERVIEVERSEA